MKFRKSKRFQRSFDQLPAGIREKARKAFTQFKQQPRPPFYPSLVIKKIQGSINIWEGRIDSFYRFTFEILIENGETIYCFRNIGPHDITSDTP